MDSSSFFPIERNRYFYGKLLTVRDFEIEQNYFRSKRQLLNRVALGAGVLCGLGVTASDNTTLIIESGMALDYAGREIVVEEPLIRKLQMLEGCEGLKGQNSAYLCLAYAEEEVEPVNAVGADVGMSRQFNMTRERYKLFLTADAPEYRSLLEASGEENVNVIYTGDELTMVLCAPSAVIGGEEFVVKLLIVKNDRTPPVHFTLDGESAFVESANGRITLAYNQSGEEKRNVITAEFRLRAQTLSGLSSPLFPNGAELNIELGSHRYKNYISVDAPVWLCQDSERLKEHKRKFDGLRSHISGRDIPVYLAKLELIHSGGGVFLGSVTDLPFGQSLQSEDAKPSDTNESLSVTTSVKSLEYWQPPDVKATYSPASGALRFDFALPTPEQYDYSISHGVVEITLPGGNRVNARYFSDEIPHGLGAGNVSLTLSVEFADKNGDTNVLFGNSEVFRSKAMETVPPWVEASALLYPERGTMRVGLWLHDTVEGSRIRVHYFAQKPERDTARLLNKRNVSISVEPEVAHVAKRGSLRLKATVVGSEDKAVLWSVREEHGGSVDANGIYQAPELAGTYEIVAEARADGSAKTSAFVIVE